MAHAAMPRTSLSTRSDRKTWALEQLVWDLHLLRHLFLGDARAFRKMGKKTPAGRALQATRLGLLEACPTTTQQEDTSAQIANLPNKMKATSTPLQGGLLPGPP